jgi:radical SAM superfamily enzyme
MNSYANIYDNTHETYLIEEFLSNMYDKIISIPQIVKEKISNEYDNVYDNAIEEFLSFNEKNYKKIPNEYDNVYDDTYESYLIEEFLSGMCDKMFEKKIKN